jgi:hypothetical protein
MFEAYGSRIMPSKLMKDVCSIQKLHFNQTLSVHEIAEELKARGLQPPDLTDEEVATAKRAQQEK